MDTAHSSKLTFIVNQLFLGVVVNYRVITGAHVPVISLCYATDLFLNIDMACAHCGEGGVVTLLAHSA